MDSNLFKQPVQLSASPRGRSFCTSSETNPAMSWNKAFLFKTNEIKTSITTLTNQGECQIFSRPGSVEILEYKI